MNICVIRTQSPNNNLLTTKRMNSYDMLYTIISIIIHGYLHTWTVGMEAEMMYLLLLHHALRPHHGPRPTMKPSIVWLYMEEHRSTWLHAMRAHPWGTEHWLRPSVWSAADFITAWDLYTQQVWNRCHYPSNVLKHKCFNNHFHAEYVCHS